MDDTSKQTDDTQIVDVTPIEESADETPQVVSDTVQTELSIENLIKSFISRIARLKEDIKPANEMVNDLLRNNEEYMAASDEAKEASRKKSQVKKQVLSTPEGRTASEKLESLRADLKEAQQSLSEYLGEYQKLTGSNEIEGEDGELRRIVYIAKLVRKTNLER